MNALETALYEALTGGTALAALLAGTASVYNNIAPPGSAFDYVVFNQQVGDDENMDAHRRVDWRYMVKGISSVSMAAGGSIAAEIDSLLHAIPLTVSGWTNIWQRRLSTVRYQEVTAEGECFYHCGGIYQFRLEKE